MTGSAINDWAIRLEWRRGGDVALSITGRTETREGLEAFVCDLELAHSLLAQAIEAQRAETAKTGSVEDESAVAESDVPKGCGPKEVA